MMRIFGLLTMAAALLVSAAARADEEPGKGKGKGRSPEVIFKKLDTNNDGKLSLEEFKGIASLGKGRLKDKPELVEKLFKKMDANSDGFVSLEEFKKFREEHAKKKKKGNE